jgi:hypothetical protein
MVPSGESGPAAVGYPGVSSLESLTRALRSGLFARALGLVILSASASDARAEAIGEFPVAGSSPGKIVSGPDGALWFTDSRGDRIVRFSPGGEVTSFPTPRADSNPSDIALGPDGNLWFTERNGGKIGRITPSGVLAEFLIPSWPDNSPSSITAGPDGNLWFTEESRSSGKIGRITPQGVVTEFALPTPVGGAHGITRGAGWKPLVHAGRSSQPDRANNDIWSDHGVSDSHSWISRFRDHLRHRWKPLVHRTPREPDRANHDQRRVYRVRLAGWGFRTARHHQRPRRRNLVHGAQRKQDRADHWFGRDSRIPDSEFRLLTPGYHPRPRWTSLVYREHGRENRNDPRRYLRTGCDGSLPEQCAIQSRGQLVGSIAGNKWSRKGAVTDGRLRGLLVFRQQQSRVAREGRGRKGVQRTLLGFRGSVDGRGVPLDGH